MPNNVSLPKGYKLNEYTISKRLSSGGFSVVYLAYDKNQQPVAIKEFFPNNLHLRTKGHKVDNFINMREKTSFKEGLKGFKDETEIVMKLKHRNIIEIINFFETNGTAYIVMPYEYGMTLSKYVALQVTPNEGEIISIIEGVFSAVKMFHENKIVHLDLKPGNIWLRPNKEALILDFGTARSVDDPEKSRKPPMYTPGYAAPEQYRQFFRPNRVGLWTDYYGLGATLYALLNRSSPTPSPNLIGDKEKINIKFLRHGQFNSQLLDIVEYMMELNWEKRKLINLNDVISRLKKITPVKDVKLLTEDFKYDMQNAALILKEQHK